MASIFTKIMAGEIPCHKIAENEHCFAFLDISPLAKGHTLVVPKVEVDYIFDMEDSLYQELMSFSKGIAQAIKSAIPCERIGVSVIGLEVPHAHVHLVPINAIGDLNFSGSRCEFSQEEYAAIAESIKSNLPANLTAF